MHKILPIPKGSKCTIIDVLLYSGWKYKNAEQDDVLFIVYKNEKDEKKVAYIRSPKMEIGFTIPSKRHDWKTCRAYVPLDHVYLEEIEPHKILSRIAKELRKCDDKRSRELLALYNQSYDLGDRKMRKEILKSQHAFMSDIPIEDSYRVHLALQYNLESQHIVNKAFLDIENDVAGLTTAELNDHRAPMTVVTIIFDYDCINSPVKGGGRPQVFTIILRDHVKYPQQVYFEEHLDEFIQQCKNEFGSMEVKRKGKSFKVENTDADYHFKFFEDEAELIKYVFYVLNYFRPDTCAVWNIEYDIPQMKGRLEHLGHNPVDIMSDPVFPKQSRFIDIHIDKRGFINFADRKTYIKMTSTIRYIDQMLTYAQLRKGGKAYGSNKLDNIGEVELGIKKRKFAKGINVTNAAYKDWWNYVLYNINDVWMQVILERFTNDIMTLIVDSNQAACPIENLTKQTRYQKQIFYLNELRRGFIPGNNKNNNYRDGITDKHADERQENKRANKIRKLLDSDEKLSDEEINRLMNESEFLDDEDDPDVIEASKIEDIYSDYPYRKFRIKGGLVGNPNLNEPNGVELVKGVPSKNVRRNVGDSDYKSMYPYEKVTRSISGPTQVGRLIIYNKVSDKQNPFNTNGYIPGAEFISDYISQDWLWLGEVWFNLPGVEDAEKELGLLED